MSLKIMTGFNLSILDASTELVDGIVWLTTGDKRVPEDVMFFVFSNYAGGKTDSGFQIDIYEMFNIDYLLPDGSAGTNFNEVQWEKLVDGTLPATAIYSRTFAHGGAKRDVKIDIPISARTHKLVIKWTWLGGDYSDLSDNYVGILGDSSQKDI
jgi:hypothetical protein